MKQLVFLILIHWILIYPVVALSNFGTIGTRSEIKQGPTKLNWPQKRNYNFHLELKLKKPSNVRTVCLNETHIYRLSY